MQIVLERWKGDDRLRKNIRNLFSANRKRNKVRVAHISNRKRKVRRRKTGSIRKNQIQINRNKNDRRSRSLVTEAFKKQMFFLTVNGQRISNW